MKIEHYHEYISYYCYSSLTEKFSLVRQSCETHTRANYHFFSFFSHSSTILLIMNYRTFSEIILHVLIYIQGQEVIKLDFESTLRKPKSVLRQLNTARATRLNTYSFDECYPCMLGQTVLYLRVLTHFEFGLEQLLPRFLSITKVSKAQVSMYTF